MYLIFLLVLLTYFVKNFALITNLLSEIRYSVILWLQSSKRMNLFFLSKIFLAFRKIAELIPNARRILLFELTWYMEIQPVKFIVY